MLVVDDEEINREILGLVLENEYEVLFASDGHQALECIHAKHDTLSLILLDLKMPVMSGTELLRRIKANPKTAAIPVIVLTSDEGAEIECLDLGASDFIPKPYPQAGVILARIRRTIELSEDRDIIQSTERDPLTGLYNREFFYRYAEQYDQHHKETDMDAVVLDIYHFRLINERFGTAYGDRVLHRVGENVREMIRAAGGIVCRREADTFLIYCPHQENYEELLCAASVSLADGDFEENHVRLRVGIYSVVDKSIDVERRFDRANTAANTIRNSVTRTIAYYDSALHEKELYAERLVENFHRAIREEQFKVFFQPKFDIRSEIPVLASAEALVRWIHPDLGLISPGVFIPLFEENGLIQELDQYVWQHAAAQIADWKARFGFAVPVSVNVSRIDIYDPSLVETLQQILSKNALTPQDLLLEITESAYTQDSSQMIGIVNRLRALGFKIEMDDFGTGYSSLNMISSLPIDALKLDMQFIRSAFSERRDTRMLEVIIDIADYLSVPVIAEGVETAEQLSALKAMGCDLVQGYYFSKPVPANEFERFVLERIEYDRRCDSLPSAPAAVDDGLRQDVSLGRLAYALSSGFESIYYVNTLSNHYVEFSSQGRYRGLQIQQSGADFFADTQRNIKRFVYGEDQTQVAFLLQKETLLAQLAANQPFSITYRLVIAGAPVFYNLKVVRAQTNDDHHVVVGVSNVDAQATPSRAETEWQNAVTYSRIAQALSRDYYSIYYVDIETDEFIEYSSQSDYQELHVEQSGVDFFEDCRRNIMRLVYSEDREKALSVWEKSRLLPELENGKVFSTTYRLMFDGEPHYISCKVIRMDDVHGGRHIVIGISNVDEQMKRENELILTRERVYRDPLTGVKSKHAYIESERRLNDEITAGHAEPFSIVVCDVNGLKRVNDSLGHKAGDRLIRDAAMEICNIFEHSPVLRYGGDEFVVLLRGRDWKNRDALMACLMECNVKNRESGGIVIACGLADFEQAVDDSVCRVFARADANMYKNKQALKHN